MNEATQQAAPPSQKYQRITDSVFARQFTGSNHQEMLEFAPGYLYLAPNGDLMQVHNPFPIANAEWVLQARNGVNIGTYSRMTDDVFVLTWTVGGP